MCVWQSASGPELSGMCDVRPPANVRQRSEYKAHSLFVMDPEPARPASTVSSRYCVYFISEMRFGHTTPWPLPVCWSMALEISHLNNAWTNHNTGFKQLRHMTFPPQYITSDKWCGAARKPRVPTASIFHSAVSLNICFVVGLRRAAPTLHL